MSDHAPLRLVNPDTGEITEHCPNCAHLQDQLDGAEKDVRAWRARHAALKRDKEKEARTNKLWPLALELFGEWKVECNHPRAQWSADRFFLAEPHLKAHGVDMARRAIAGAKFDPMTKQRRNGSIERFDNWDLIFRDAARFESFCNRAPRGWKP